MDTQKQLQKLDKGFITLNKIRLTFIIFVLSLTGSLFLDKTLHPWFIYILVLSIFFVILFVFYIPSYYKSFGYLLTEKYIVIFSGVIFSRKILLRMDSITKISLYQTWFQKIFKIQSIILFSPGQTTLIPCLDKRSVDQIFKNFNY